MAETVITKGYKNSNINLTQAYVQKLFEYNPETGILVWKQTLSKRAIKGTIAGFVNQSRKTKRIKVGICGIEYPAHRIIWLIMTGVWPEKEIDHIDGNGENNKWNNLREASSSQNLINVKMWRHNTTGYKGVTFLKSGKYAAYTKRNGKQIWFGTTHNTAEDAYEAYKKGIEKLHAIFNSS